MALISDVHGNLVALESVLADIKHEKPDSIIFLGDLAATGPQPQETVEAFRTLDCATVMGNADADLLSPVSEVKSDYDSRRIQDIDRWCAAQLSVANRDYLSHFSPKLKVDLDHGNSLLCCHGSPRSFNDAILSTTSERELDQLFGGYDTTLIACGHTHTQFAREYRSSTLINPGSVGLGPPHAAYALVDSAQRGLDIQLKRLSLNHQAIRTATLGSSMPHAEWWAGLWADAINHY